jgi:hypothetical protein
VPPGYTGHFSLIGTYLRLSHPPTGRTHDQCTLLPRAARLYVRIGIGYWCAGSASKTSTGCRYDPSWECGNYSALAQEAISKPAYSHPG